MVQILEFIQIIFIGSTRIDIMSNFINITGYASSHPWALLLE